jgi:hypothetical protein
VSAQSIPFDGEAMRRHFGYGKNHLQGKEYSDTHAIAGV